MITNSNYPMINHNLNRNDSPDGSNYNGYTKFLLIRNTSVLLSKIIILFFGVGCYDQTIETADPDTEDDRLFFYDWIEQDSILDLTLTLDLENIKASEEEELYQDELLIIRKGQDTLACPVKVSARGKTRKKICSFPPLRIRINDSIADANHWGPHRKYKIVTHCEPDRQYENLLLKEYLVYRLYHKLTPISFRAQLCKITYQMDDQEITRFAALLEDDDILLKRLGAEAVDSQEDDLRSINKEAYQNLVMFQYMIGNTDWNLGERHNIILLKLPDSPSPVPVPYDFDYSGVVKAPYATPYPTLPIQNVRERFFQYRGSPNDDFSAIISRFEEQKSDIITSIESFPHLESEDITDMTGYLNEFYMELSKPDWLDRVRR